MNRKIQFFAFRRKCGGLTAIGWMSGCAAPSSCDSIPASAIALLHDRPALDGRATAYVCRGFACRRPVTHPDELAAQLLEA